jgi:20S proteasome subunit beta 7
VPSIQTSCSLIMNHFPEAWGRVCTKTVPLLCLANPSQPRDDVYGPYNNAYLQPAQETQHTQSPIVTGTSVVALKFKDGVVIAADNLGMLVILQNCHC